MNWYLIVFGAGLLGWLVLYLLSACIQMPGGVHLKRIDTSFEESTMQNIGAYLAAGTFWIFIGAVAIAGMVYDYKRRRIGIEVLRLAIEKGQPLDPALVEKLTSYEHKDAPIEPVQVKIGGVITIAGGVGVGLLSFFVGRVFPIAFYPTLGAGVLVICVGVGLLIGARALAQARDEKSRNAVS
jgi:Domain of unknown function (DUF6249)